jgi:hypothetical protein
MPKKVTNVDDIDGGTSGTDVDDNVKESWRKIKGTYFGLSKRPCYAAGKRIDAEPASRRYVKKSNVLDEMFTDEMRVSIARTKERMYVMHEDPDLRWTPLSSAATGSNKDNTDPYLIAGGR